jgi:putative transcriptional regulator
LSTELCLRHECLLAMPDLRDDPFRGSVVYLCDHDADGAMGFVINRVTEMTLADLFAQLDLPAPSAASCCTTGTQHAHPCPWAQEST